MPCLGKCIFCNRIALNLQMFMGLSQIETLRFENENVCINEMYLINGFD